MNIKELVALLEEKGFKKISLEESDTKILVKDDVVVKIYEEHR